MLLGAFYEGLELHREDRIIYARFLVPHRVVSTCRAAGGLREDLEYVYNHQSCEPAGHLTAHASQAWRDVEGYRRLVAEPNGLPPERCATLGTAANMHNACLAVESFRAHQVVAIATGGVEGNAGRVGDPASLYEADGEHQQIAPPEPPAAGTINTMLFFSQELTPGALVRSIVTATEAKTAALQELNVNSLYSAGLATGTGTDQVAAACRLDGVQALTGAGKHSKLGELIGRAVQKAIMGALALQNRLTPAGQCAASLHLKRFGGDRATLLAGVQVRLAPELAALAAHNFNVIDRDPPTVAAMAALVHLWDKLTWGVLPASCRGEILASQAAQVAVAVSGRGQDWADYRRRLAPAPADGSPAALVDLACRALALGFAAKWPPEA
ncbi:MAG: adenosylcobinamide amidohydrolase [Pseudomonadota bacterium]